MKAKGTAVKSLSDFIIEEHGTEGFQRWLTSLPPASQKIFSQRILVNSWYPFEDAVPRPMAAMAQIFYEGRTDGNWKEGRYTAEKDLHGIYRFFVRVANPQFLMRNTAGIWKSYFADSEARLAEGDKSRAVLLLSGIEPACRYFDHHVGGWVERALEICGCRNIKFDITNPERGTTRFEINWEY